MEINYKYISIYSKKKNKIKFNIFKKVIFIINFFFFLNNIILIFNYCHMTEPNFQIIYNENFLFKFKSSEYFIFILLIKKYSEFANYLINKYNKNISNLEYTKILYKKKKNKIKKRKIILYSVDLFDPKYHRKWIKNKLKDKFIIKFNSYSAEYLLFNIFGDEHLNPKYNKCIKIAVFTENKIPDFNEADYALGQSHIIYLDRYFKFPIFLWYDIKNFNMVRKNVLNNQIRKKFCAAVVSNNFSTDGFRLKFINELSKYKKVDMGGKYENNIGGQINSKFEFFSSYKFSIAMENSEGDGYISEKIIDSFISGTIPIYYGDYMIDEYINPKSYILIRNEKDIKEKINYIKEIDNNDEIYKNLLKENVIIDENSANKIEKEEKEFLEHIFEQGKYKSIRRN